MRRRRKPASSQMVSEGALYLILASTACGIKPWLAERGLLEAKRKVRDGDWRRADMELS